MLELVAAFDPETISRWVEAGGVYVLFLLLFSCGLGVPLPEDIPLILGGIGIAFWGFDPIAVGIACWAGIIGGDVCLYFLGRSYGHNIRKLPVIGKHISEQNLQKVERLFARYGIWVVAIGRLFAGIRGAMVVAAGTTRFNFLKFLIADGLAALVSGGLFVWLGWWGGKKIFSDVEHAKKYIGYIVGALIVVAIAYYFWRRWRNSIAERQEAAPPPPASH